jgi:hypothetical protein
VIQNRAEDAPWSSVPRPPIEAKQVFISSYRGHEWVYTSIQVVSKPVTLVT